MASPRYMLRAFSMAICAAALLLSARPGYAQDVGRGVVWEVPEGSERAEQDLREMRSAGVTAVRTGIIRDASLLVLADTLGLSLYIDLPFARLSAEGLIDTLDAARVAIEAVLRQAASHVSIAAVGLTRYSDTSDTTACRFIDQLAELARGAGEPVYYVSRFIRADACSASVDFVLADLRNEQDPLFIWRQWEADRPPLGIAALGVRVRGDTLHGLRVPSSTERQARYFEHHMPRVLSDTLSARLPVVFVYRWRDVRLDHVSVVSDPDDPYLARYGLHSIDGARRPAMDVIDGVYTGRQAIFAFRAGEAPGVATPWTTLVGWGILLTLGMFYALSPRFRHMVPRYFQARFFFREAVREGRDVLLGASTVLLLTLGVAGGLVVFVLLDAAATTGGFEVAMSLLPTVVQGAAATLLAQPLVLVFLAGCLLVISLLAWAVVLSLLSRRKYAVTPAQVLMLVVWPRWPQLFVMVAATVAATLTPLHPYVMIALASAWVLVAAAATLRTLIDLVAVTRMPWWLLPPAVLLHPGLLLMTAALVVGVAHGSDVAFIWHAATRS